MRKLTDDEVLEIIDLAYSTCESYIFKHVNKKDFEDINITINLEQGSDCFDIDIDISLDSDAVLPVDLADNAINLALGAVDGYVEKIR